MRRQCREELTDAAMGATLPRLLRPWMTDAQRRAISEPLANLRLALDADRRSAVIGAAKDLLEAACKVAIERAGQPVPSGDPAAVLPPPARGGVVCVRRPVDHRDTERRRGASHVVLDHHYGGEP
jgi:hypothetical protein